MSFANETWLALRNDGVTGDGSPGNPFEANSPSSFYERMKSLNPNTMVRLGPGIFRTRGTTGDGYNQDGTTYAWLPKTGQRLIGSGIFSTVLQFVWDLPPESIPALPYHPGQNHSMIRSPEYLNSFELSDLTVDCNLQNAPFGPRKDSGSVIADVSGTTVMASANFFTSDMVGSTIVIAGFSARIMSVGSNPGNTATISASPPSAINDSPFQIFGVRFSVMGVAVAGDNVRIRRVRVINFGTRTPLLFDGAYDPTGTRTYERFPLRIEGRSALSASFNSFIEDCLIEQPYPSPGREVTFVVGGGVRTQADPSLGQKLHLEPFGCGIRNCYMNFDFVNPRPGNPIPIDDPLTFPAAGKVRVKTRFPHRFYVGDSVEIIGGGVPALNKRFKVTEIGGAGTGDTLYAERHFTIDLSPQPSQPTGAIVFFSPLPTLPVSTLEQDTGSIVKATTAVLHKREVDDWVCISGVTNDEKYNGTFKVTAIDSNGLWFKYSLGAGVTPSQTPAAGTFGSTVVPMVLSGSKR